MIPEWKYPGERCLLDEFDDMPVPQFTEADRQAIIQNIWDRYRIVVVLSSVPETRL